MITLWETLPHYGRHLRPLCKELFRRGVDHRYHRGGSPPQHDEVLVTGAYRDLPRQRNRFSKLVLVEHGVGQAYRDSAHVGYTGGTRRAYDLHLAPGPACVDEAARERVEVGCLPLAGLTRADHRETNPAIGLTWHWPCRVSTESGTAFEEYRAVLPQLSSWAAKQDFVLLGHQHPRWKGALNAAYYDAGVESTRDADDLLARCGLLIADNTSLLFEAAALGLPVVVVNSQAWRREVEHGKRFWEWADVGLQVNHPDELIRAVEETLCCDPQAARRAAIVAECYGTDPRPPLERAVDGILGLL